MSQAAASQQLVRCFQIVFPSLREADLATASSESVSDWDSVAQITLISVIEEEFGITLPDDKYGEMLSFAAWAAYLERPEG